MGREKGYKTRQKTAILDYLKDNRDRHVTVNEIANYLRDSENPVGVTTVYRYMDSLLQAGIVQKYLLDSEGGAFYEYIGENCCNEHFHLKCEGCGDLIHMECGQIRELYDHIKTGHDFGVNSIKTVFYGTCEKCRQTVCQSEIFSSADR